MRLFSRGKRTPENTEQGIRRTRDTWFGRVTQLFHSNSVSNKTWEELEEALISSDVGVNTALELVERAREQTGAGGAEAALQAVKQELVSLLKEPAGQGSRIFEEGGARPKPLVILVVGVNGSGKTTSIAKLTRTFMESGDKVVLGAADTFRAAAIDQLQTWAGRLGAEVVANQPGGDPAAVAFDALQAGKSRNADVVIIDTAGRLHTKSNLMEELKKIRRVLERQDPEAPHLTVLVLDATTGQNGLAQAKAFTEAVKCDGVLLAKLDGTAKGGVVFAIGEQLGLPVLFIGTGEDADALSPFEPETFVEALFASSSAEIVA